MNLKNYLKETEGPSLEAFKKLVDRHDLTYSYSDDGNAWRRGDASMKAIRDMKLALIKEDPANEEKCIKIWNDAVDKKIAASSREDWYWSKK